jgi:glycosyltransferase involved in cell wall biosynthesis
MARPSRYDVAVYAPYAGVLYQRGSDAATGGAETQMRHLTAQLAERGLRVCHIVFDYPGMEEPEGVRLVRQPADRYQKKWVLYPPVLWRALDEADARVYIQRGAGFETGVIGSYARVRSRRFVFSSSSMVDFQPAPDIPSASARAAYRLGLRLADALVVQTDDQKRAAGCTSACQPSVIRSFCDLPPEPGGRQRDAFLWIGGLIGYKQPLEYLALAERVPHARFRMVVHDRGERWCELAAEVRARGAALPNVEIVEHMSRDRLLPLYERAIAVVNTSLLEGFPNTFMEAWARGTPVLSLHVDPDDTIEKYGLGTAGGGSLDRLAEAADSLWERRDAIEGLAATARAYVAEVHDPPRIAAQWAELIERVSAQ